MGKKIVNSEDIQRIAKMSRLKISEQEEAHVLRDINSILNLIQQLQIANVENVPPIAHIQKRHQTMREDLSISHDRKKVLSNAPQQENGCFLVPKVIE